MKLTNEHIEEQILLMLDGELNEADSAALLAWIGQHPEHKPMLEAYRSVYLEPGGDMLFPDKEILLQPESPVSLPFHKKKTVWMRAAAAVFAGVCITAAASYFLQQKQPARQSEVAANHKKDKQAHAVSVSDTAKAVALQTPVTKQHPAAHMHPATIQHKAAGQAPIPAIAQPLPVQEKDPALETLAMMEQSGIAVEQPEPAKGIVRGPTDHIAAAQTPEAPPSWGPVKSESLEGINELVSRVQTIRENIAGKAKSLKHATFVLRLGDKEIAIGK